MIKFFITLIFLLLFFILSIPLFLIELLIGLFSKKARDKSSFVIVTLAFKIILFISGAKIIIKGLENVPADVPVLYVANHRSFFDIVIGYSLVKGITGFVSKKEVKKVPILAQWMYFMNCIFLDRDNIKEGLKAILAAIEQVKSGVSMFIFPEGTRAHADNEMIAFKEGSMKIAEKSGCPIIPVAFGNTSAIFEDHFPKIKKATIYVTFGEPIYINKLEKEQKKFLGGYTHDIIKRMLEESH